jgi:hypothetical protein
VEKGKKFKCLKLAEFKKNCKSYEKRERQRERKREREGKKRGKKCLKTNTVNLFLN